MRLRTRLLFLLCSLLIGAPAAASGSPLLWTAGDLPPFSWINNAGPQGYAYELAVQMSARLGRQSTVSFYPWARAVRQAQEGENFGVFPLARTPDRERQFRWLIPLVHVRYTFFGRGGTELGHIEALRHARVGVLRGSPIIRNLQAQNFRTVIEAKDYRELLRMLGEGDIAAIYAGELMLGAAIEEYGFRPQDIRAGMSLGEADLYMATSLKLDPAEAERWLQAWRELQQDGAVARLQKKYLKDR